MYDPAMDIEKKRELWDRLENEPERAYRAFEAYRHLPSAERTLIEAYRGHVGNPDAAKPSDTWSRWSSEFAWRERAAAYDAHIDRLREKSMEKVIQQEAEEQARQLEMMRGRFNELMTIAYCEAMEYMESGDFLSQMRPQDVINIMKLYFEVTQKMGDTNTQSTDSVVDWSEDEPPHCCMVGLVVVRGVRSAHRTRPLARLPYSRGHPPRCGRGKTMGRPYSHHGRLPAPSKQSSKPLVTELSDSTAGCAGTRRLVCCPRT